MASPDSSSSHLSRRWGSVRGALTRRVYIRAQKNVFMCWGSSPWVQGLGFRVYRVKGLEGFRVYSSGIRARGIGCEVCGVRREV